MNYKDGITVHTLVKNEEKWIWFAIMSVITYVDRLIIYDTGSTDKTVDIINEILKVTEFAKKIDFEEKGSVSKTEFTKLRQEQVDKTFTKWFLVLDGDEIWYEGLIKKLVRASKLSAAKMLAVRFHNCTKDVFHYSGYDTGSYNIKGEKGNITLKLINRNITGLHADGPYGVEGYFDSSGNPIQNNESDIEIVDGFFLHTSNLVRSKNLLHDWKIPYRRVKVFSRAEEKVPESFLFPEVFYNSRPSFVPDPFQKAGLQYELLKLALLPFRLVNYFKRKF